MDRFIESKYQALKTHLLNLKSNMDRFIGLISLWTINASVHLKSNMDRFIADILAITKTRIEKFKIQYG